MKIATIIGARPQFIKAAAVRREIQKYNQRSPSVLIQEILVHTGQHYDDRMDKVFFEELELPQPDYHLGVGSGSHGRQTGMMLERIESVLQKEKPGVVMVYGDTNSTLAGALSAAKLNIPVAHVEAGLRSFNQTMPEEINRVVADHLSTFLFCPTNQAVKNLAKEGIKPAEGKVVRNVGDVMYDSILYYLKLSEERSTILEKLHLLTPNSKLRTLHYYLATLHRAENTDDAKRLRSILTTLDELGKNVPVILPLHPRTKKMIAAYHLQRASQRIQLVEPVSYLDMLTLEKNAKVILTDSGGVQKEAYWLKVPCITLREETEWVETIKSGWNVLAGLEEKKIRDRIRWAQNLKRSGRVKGLFGNGKAARNIIHLMMRSIQ